MKHSLHVPLFLGLLFLLLSSCDKKDDDPIVLSSKKEISSFVIAEIEGVIDETAKTISLNLLSGTNLTSLSPEISISLKATISPSSGVAQDFTNPVTYTITAEDGSSDDYAVTVVDECASDRHVYSFTYDGKNYEIIKLNRTWEQASACAVERGGYLAEINDAAENTAIFKELRDNADIDLDNTVGLDGGLASFVWIGGNDAETEGTWVWDGNNDKVGIPFWQGEADGVAIDDRFSSWGNEPDNSAGQDGLGMALTQWPLSSGVLGSAGQWNDIKLSNSLYYVVEFD